MRLMVLILALLLIGCAENKTETNVFLQQQELSIAQPRVDATSTIIDSTVIVTADMRIDGVKIYYTNDGTEPNETSLIYKTPLAVDKAGTYKFKAFHEDWNPSAISELKLYKKGYVPEIIQWETKVNSTYPGLGSTTVFNHKKGSLNFRDEQWVGFDTIAKATTTFEKEIQVEKIAISYLIDTKSWIFPPSEVTVYINEKDRVRVTIPKLTETKDVIALRDVTIPINRLVTSIAIAVKNTDKLPDWHPGSGLKAWLFMDEWIFN